MHFDIVRRLPVGDYPELFGSIADHYFEKKMYDEAVEVYQEMCQDENVSALVVSIFVFRIVATHTCLYRSTRRICGKK